MRFKYTALTALTAATALTASPVSAAPLATWDFANEQPGETSTPVGVAANVIASNQVTGPGLPAGNAGVSGSNANGFARSSVISSDIAGSVANGDYFGFTLEAADGFLLSLDSVAFDVGFNTSNQSNNDVFFQVRTSFDGFASDIGPVLTYDEDTDGDLNGTANSSAAVKPVGPVDLSFITGATDPVEVRIYLFDDEIGSATPLARVDNVVISGEVAPIPEPASLALLGLGGLLIAGRHRRRA